MTFAGKHGRLLNIDELQDELQEVYQMGITCGFSSHLSQLDPSPGTLEDLFGQVLLSGFLTSSDRQHLKAVLLEDKISDEHQVIINRLIYGVRRGFLKVAS
ncbi:hypothetical protein [Microcoleus sp. FACHB-68]|uniref:hypothetical protein n=1 Tax=Microcoleus sp. FACHB-68 TaxID=2692826 RepID=UPI00321F90C9